MTRGEHRATCIEAMRAAYRTELNSDGRAEERQGGLRAMTAAFDSLHGIAFVDPIEATEEMIEEGADMMSGLVSEGREGRAAVKIFAAMAARGDLTNTPEEKP